MPEKYHFLLSITGLPTDFLKTVNTKLKGLVLNIKEYLLTEKLERRNYILKVSHIFCLSLLVYLALLFAEVEENIRMPYHFNS